MHVIDHFELHTADYERTRRFYEQALAPLGISVIMEVRPERPGGYASAGFGRGRKPSFWLAKGGSTRPTAHFAFVADNRAAVDGFHKAALAAGGTDNGPPGLRPHYSANYYAAFVIDLEGHNIEAVCREPE